MILSTKKMTDQIVDNMLLGNLDIRDCAVFSANFPLIRDFIILVYSGGHSGVKKGKEHLYWRIYRERRRLKRDLACHSRQNRRQLCSVYFLLLYSPLSHDPLDSSLEY